MSRWLPLFSRSTRPGLGVTATSYRRACWASLEASRLSRRFTAWVRISSVRSWSWGTLWVRLLAQPAAASPQIRHRLGVCRWSFSPSGDSTSISYSRPRGVPSSSCQVSSLTREAGASTTRTASLPVYSRMTSLCSTGIRSTESTRSRSSRPMSKPRRINSESLMGPAIFMVKETRGF